MRYRSLRFVGRVSDPSQANGTGRRPVLRKRRPPPGIWTKSYATACILSCLLLACCGCGAATGASGKVTYEGTDVEEGFITFFPNHPKGSAKASPIKAGAYQVSDLTPGPHIVEVTASKKIQFALSSEEMEAKFKAAKAKGNATGVVESADLIPANARGNRQAVDIKPGRQTLDFHLKKP